MADGESGPVLASPKGGAAARRAEKIFNPVKWNRPEAESGPKPAYGGQNPLGKAGPSR